LSPTADSDCFEFIEYRSEFSDGVDRSSWATQTSSGRGISWPSNDSSIAGSYRIKTTGFMYNDPSVTAYAEWDLNIMTVDCASETLTIVFNGL
jgi:hypothetical protein